VCDEAAILACSVYVDLNVIRAGLARTPEESDHTSAQRRIEARQQIASAVSSDDVEAAPGTATVASSSAAADAWLAPLALEESTTTAGPLPSNSPARCSDKGFLPLSLDEYLQLLDWTGREIVSGKRGAIPGHLEPIFMRLGIPASHWLDLTQNFGRLFQRVAGGRRACTEFCVSRFSGGIS
jgi:hypothetical protein